MKLLRIATMGAVAIAATAIIVIAGHHDESTAYKSPAYHVRQPITLPTTPGTYLGVYASQGSSSYAGVTAFTTTTGVRPSVVAYYSGWREPFPEHFAAAVAKNNAVLLVQIEPSHVSLTAIANSRYDNYLTSYAEAVRHYGRPVILSFGHEMNGSWYSWGYRHASPAAFVKAWRHVVNVFRTAGAYNATWLWTVNIMSNSNGDRIPSPAAWWPGSLYVNWVGIDGYYYKPSWLFTSLFGPTIAAVRALTSDPILIAETGAPPAIQPAKIADLFAGVHAFGLLGLVWFNATGTRDWRLSTPAAITAFQQGAETYKRPVP
jgi:mannan endo-1,4-beta-mannosidase